MKKFLFLLSVVCLSCKISKSENLPKSYLDAKCDKIIIMDSTDYNTIVFVVSFTNNSNDDIVLFANSAYKKTLADTYKNAGLILKTSDFVSPIGTYISQLIHIEPNSYKKYAFIFSNNYPNGWIDVPNAKSTRDELTSIAKSVSLSYKYDANEMQKVLNEVDVKNLKAKTINEDFEVTMNNPSIEYNNKLSIEEVIGISSGKVRTVRN